MNIPFSELKVGQAFSYNRRKAKPGPMRTGGGVPCSYCGCPASIWRNAEDESYENDRGGHIGIHVCPTTMVEPTGE